MGALADGGSDEPIPAPSAPRSLLTRLLIPAVVGLLIWWVLPGVPHDQTVIFALGDGSTRVSQLEVHWEGTGSDHAGQVTLNFPSAPAAPPHASAATSAPTNAPDNTPNHTPTQIAHQFRLPDGEYSFRISARRTGVSNRRTEVTRRVTLDGNTLILRLEELTR